MKTEKLNNEIENEMTNGNVIDGGTLYADDEITEVSYVFLSKKMYRVEKIETKLGCDENGEMQYEDSTVITEINTKAEQEEIIENLSEYL